MTGESKKRLRYGDAFLKKQDYFIGVNLFFIIVINSSAWARNSVTISSSEKAHNLAGRFESDPVKLQAVALNFIDIYYYLTIKQYNIFAI